MGSRTDRSSAWHGVTEGWIPSRGGPRAGQAPCFLPTQVPPLLPPEILFCSFWASSFPEALLPWLSLPTSREAKQEEVGSHPPLQQFLPSTPRNGSRRRRVRRDAGMRRLPWLCGTGAGPSGMEAACPRGRICFIFPVEGRGIINANY